ncbi:MAG: acetate uptake transporter [Methanomicrobiales archaeon]
MTTVLLNLLNAGLFSRGSVISAMGIFSGGLAQIIAGIMEWKKNSTFAATAFVSYSFSGSPWFSLSLCRCLGGEKPFPKKDLSRSLRWWVSSHL